MESLRFTTLIPCKSYSGNLARPKLANHHHEVTAQVGFNPLWNKRSKTEALRLVATKAGSQDGASVVEDQKEEEKGVKFGAERDSSGSVIGFNLSPPNGDVVIESEDVTSDRIERAGDVGGKEKPKAKVTRNVIFVTAEAAPYSKTGGLGDVCGSLPVVLARRGHRVMVVSPRYLNGSPADKNFSDAVDVGHTNVICFGGKQEVAFFHEYREGVDWVFVDHPSFHRPGNPYGDSFGAFGDNQFRFTLLSHAACEAPLVLPLGGYTYGQHCLFMVNDWHAGLVPLLLAAKYRPHGVYTDARSVLVIHNLAHQGVESAVTYKNLGLPAEWYGALEWVFPEWARAHALDKGEAVNILKGAVVTCDRILTVSEGYAWEITTVEGGYGLNGLLSSRKSVLNGITNGIDVDEWDPSTDKHIASHYSSNDLSGKVECKIALQKELGLPIRPDCPLIGFIGRLDYQKGIDLIQSGIPELMSDDVQFVMLGSGDVQCQDWMRLAEATYKDKFRGWVGFNVPVSHRITAGCDILLMPSRFEPCGLNQLYAMRYGTIPVVHSTGGLRDTVVNFNPYAEGGGEGTGWTFSPLTKESMLAALRLAVRTYKEYKPSWDGLVKRGMEKDFTWESAAIQYEQVFEWAFIDPPYVA
ncbi:soluble starch synthase 1, chloroplastic/amyloplastic [Argentina anserina]|uniref:soluble starch synthase 1, chloroplastic/amyloplastic n=1 Tax=Argentina anserina TaxID=57926 RepID=UPI00217692DB|nr:soluble starch synthase 1, chloroplastic/amyloplastic [Potentilla anserina]